MRRLRPSLLLRGSEARLTAALVLAAQTLFLWMFLSADPIERLARGDLAVLLFASDWRHGMAGNSWLYMPGFFAVAAAVWLCGRHSPVPAIVTHLSASAAAATFVAAAGSILGARLAADQLLISTGIALGAALPGPSAIGTARGLYTLATWTSFVLACRHALAHRTWRPFIVPAVMSIGLALIRPWMVDDFTTLWAQRVATGDLIACTSAAAIPALATLLGAGVQRSQSRANPNCAAGTRRAATTSSR